MQRLVLAKLAENTADPLEDFKTEPYYQSWSRLQVLVGGEQPPNTHFVYDSGYESMRRAVLKLAKVGAVETLSLCAVDWRRWDDDNGSPPPGARLREWRHVGTGEPMQCWETPHRSYGQQQLHVRLALPPRMRVQYRRLIVAAGKMSQRDADLYFPLPSADQIAALPSPPQRYRETRKRPSA